MLVTEIDGSVGIRAGNTMWSRCRRKGEVLQLPGLSWSLMSGRPKDHQVIFVGIRVNRLLGRRERRKSFGTEPETQNGLERRDPGAAEAVPRTGTPDPKEEVLPS